MFFFFLGGVVGSSSSRELLRFLFWGELFIWQRELLVLLLPWLFWFLIERGEFFFFLLFIYVGYEERL